MIITLAGEPGAGKTTVARWLATELGYEHYSSGGIWRSLAHERGITIEALNAQAEHDSTIDIAFDAKLKTLGATHDKLVIDSWMAWHVIPRSFKVYLAVDPQVSAARVFANQRPDESPQPTVAAVASMLQARHEKLCARYRAVYGVEITNPSNYDLVVDTTSRSPEEIGRSILKAAANRVLP